MSFFDYVTLVVRLLQREGEVTYRTLQREFGFDAAFLDDLRHELIYRGVARDRAGEGLEWSGVAEDTQSPTSLRAYPVVRLGLLPPLNQLADDEQEPEIARFPPTTRPSELPSSLSLPINTRPLSNSASPATPNWVVPEAERRQLTVMFCEFVSLSSHPQHLDPETLREAIQTSLEAAAYIIDQYQGYIAQYLDDGLLVYFGYPSAHEDDARRAVHTALGIIGKMETLHSRFGVDTSISFAARLSIHTGPVVVGDMGGGNWHEQLALGATPNIAARLQHLAMPNTVVLSAVTARLVHVTFALKTLGMQVLRGVPQPIEAWQVEGVQVPEDDDGAYPQDRTALLVGRDEEKGLLLRRWYQSKEGHGQVVVLSGEAGIGKTSLVENLRAEVIQEGLSHLTLRCSPYHQNSALYPVIEHIYQVFKMTRGEASDLKLAKLKRGLKPYRFATDDVITRFAQLLSIPLPEDHDPSLEIPSTQQRQQTLDALVAWQLEAAERQPFLMVFEDLHWADPSTLDVLGLLIEQAPTVAVLTVCTFRPEFIPPWPLRSHMTPLTLNRLDRSQVELLLNQLAMGKRLPPTAVQHIVEKTDGVPLYVEELTKMLLESDMLCEETDHYRLRGQLSEVMIPATLHDSLMARLDRLPTVREVAQLGAVLGREFAYEMLQPLAALTAIEETRLQDGLSKLVDAELLYQRGRPPRAKYTFKHALVRDAAYQSLLRRTRQYYHERVAQLLVTDFPALVESEPEVIAHHYTEAGSTEPALAYWCQAGQRAIQRSANLEAIEHLSRGLSILSALPDASSYVEQELQLHTTLGPAYMAAKGYAADEVEQSYLRARELCEQVGETRQLFQTMLGLWNVYLVRAEIARARDLAEQCLALGQKMQDELRLQQAHYVLGNTLFHSGVFVTAREHLERSLTLYNDRYHHARAVQNPGVVSLSYLAWTLWHLGFPDQALQRSQDALELARELAHPYSLTFALDFSAWLYQFRGEGSAARQDVQAAIALATEQSFPLWLAMGMPLAGWVEVEQEQREAGLLQLQKGMTAFEGTGAQVFWPNMLILLADSYAQLGRIETGLTTVEAALTTIENNGERVSEAELYRIKGELLLQQSLTQDAQAEYCFVNSLAISRRQQAKMLELRASVNLGRLWQRQGRIEPARELLGTVYHWFTEGFETVDLKAAKTLLNELEQ